MSTENNAPAPSADALEIMRASGIEVPASESTADHGEAEGLADNAGDAKPEGKKAEGEVPADPAAEKTDGADKAPKKSFQERMNEMTRARREAERERDEVKAQLAEALAAREAAGEAEAGDIDDDYIDQIVEQRLAQREATRKAEEAKAAFETRMAKAAEKHDDYFEKVIEGANAASPTWVCTDDMFAAIRESENGAEVAYHLATNPDEARRIAALSPHSQVREIGRIEARLEAASAAPDTQNPIPPAKTAKTVTNAPEPPPQARGTGGQFKVGPDTSDFAAFDAQYPL